MVLVDERIKLTTMPTKPISRIKELNKAFLKKKLCQKKAQYVSFF